MNESNHISSVRQMILDQMRALRGSTKEDLDGEIKRAKGMGDLAQVLVNSAKVEIDYLRATDQDRTPFLEVPVDSHVVHLEKASKEDQNGILSITRHRMAT